MSTATLTRSTPRPVLRQVARPVTRSTSRVRLTRRGRVVVVAVLAALLLAVFAMGRGGTSQADAGGAAVAPMGVTTVHAGESLWSVAKRIAPDSDAREVVAQIRSLNEMGDSSLAVGQQLLLPVAA